MNEEGAPHSGFSFPNRMPRMSPSPSAKGTCSLALESRNRSGCPGRAALQPAGCDPTLPSRRHLSGGRRKRPLGGCVMAHLTRMPGLQLLLGPLLSTSEVPKDLRDCFLCLQFKRWRLVCLSSFGWRGHFGARVLISVTEYIWQSGVLGDRTIAQKIQLQFVTLCQAF